MLKGDVTGKLDCMYDSAREELNKLLDNKVKGENIDEWKTVAQENVSWAFGDSVNGKKSSKKYFFVPTLVRVLRNNFGFELILKPRRVDDVEEYVHVEYGLYFRDSISDKWILLSTGSSRKPKNLKAGDIVGTNTVECAETAAIGRCLKFFFGVNSDLANDEEIKYSKGLSHNLTVIETLEKRRKDVPIKN